MGQDCTGRAPVSQLPGLLGEIAAIAGEVAALKIAAARGGVKVDIPARARPGHWLVDCVGQELADRICKHFSVLTADGSRVGARSVVIPRGPMTVVGKARSAAIAALQAGASVSAAALQTGLAERSVQRIKARLKDDRQGELF